MHHLHAHALLQPSYYLFRPPPPLPTLFPYTTLFRSPPTASQDATQRTGRNLLLPANMLYRIAVCRRMGAVASLGRSLLRSEEHTSELQSLRHLVCRLLLEKKKNMININKNHKLS